MPNERPDNTQPSHGSDSSVGGLRALFFKLAGVLVLVGSFAGAWLLMDYQSFARTPLQIPEAGLQLEVPPGMALRDVARELHARGVLERPWLLVLMARWQGRARMIQAGEYDLAKGTTPPELLDRLVSGKVTQYTLTVVEGWTFAQLLDAVARHTALKQTLSDRTHAQIMEHLGFAGEHPEGRFFPDTYHFPRGTSDVAFLQRAYKMLQSRLDQEWVQRADGLPYANAYEALIMASIIEKETAVPDERTQIAGVFVRRLQQGMRLQTDPTVIYGLGASFDGDIRSRDLTRETPYNTYLREGLPPTPIALPGGASIHAALHPAPGRSLYFVARGDGTHQFSDTLEEHNQAVVRYQLNGRARNSGASSAPAAGN